MGRRESRERKYIFKYIYIILRLVLNRKREKFRDIYGLQMLIKYILYMQQKNIIILCAPLQVAILFNFSD